MLKTLTQIFMLWWTKGKYLRVPELYGTTMMSWARAEFCMKFVILLFSKNEKILKKLSDPEKFDPNTAEIIDELQKCAREAYGDFILERGARLKMAEKKHGEVPGEYSEKGFDEFIKDLHVARKSRNSLVHDIAQKEMVHIAKVRHEPWGAKLSKFSESLLDDMIVPMSSMLKVVVPMCDFALWTQLKSQEDVGKSQ